jgi:hypothetical protein
MVEGDPAVFVTGDPMRVGVQYGIDKEDISTRIWTDAIDVTPFLPIKHPYEDES